MFERIREDVHCVFERDPAARNAFDVLTTYPGIHAILMHRFSHWLWTQVRRRETSRAKRNQPEMDITVLEKTMDVSYSA